MDTIRQCGSCGAMEMTFGEKDLSADYKGKNITIPAVRGWHCNACGEAEFARQEDAEQYSQAVAAAMQAEDDRVRHFIRAARKRLGLKQSEAASLFGGGVNAFSEYERGVRQPGKAILVLLELLLKHPDLLSEIRSASHPLAV